MRAMGKTVLAAVVLSVAVTGCEREPPRQHVRLTAEPGDGTAPATAAAPAVLRVGVASVLSPRETLRYYRDLIDYMGERLGMPTEMLQRSSYAEMNELLRRRYCHVALICNYAYVRAHREFAAELLAMPQINNQQTYRGYVIVARDSPVESLEQLAGKRFAYSDPMCNAGWLYPAWRLKQLGHNPRAFFGSEMLTYSYENSIYAVAEALADAAGVESPLYDWMIARKNPAVLNTRILERSPPFGTPPVVAHPLLDSQLRARVREFFLTLHDTERGRELLGKIMLDRFVEPDPKLYAPVFKMAEAVQAP
jgi:phosphonate transport system substrate-binding protein